MPPKRRPAPATTPAQLKARAEKATREGRFQQALELTKQLHKQEPTAAHRALVQDAYLGRARQLRGQGMTRDAATVLQAALALEGAGADWLARVAQELAASGAVRQALALLPRLADPQAAGPALARAADAALRQGAAGRALLPPELHADFDRVVRAFQQAEAGDDEQARAALQEIGLRSPFLEWKLLLRGLLAYYARDDARALENWQRLDADRLPARLAAPLRFHLDGPFRTAQAPEAQAALQRQTDRLQGDGLVAQLRAVQQALAGEETLARAFRAAEPAAAALRQHAPRLLPRLAGCFYWAVVNGGQPEDVLRYQRVFGTPPDDPDFHRLRALVLENLGEYQKAHDAWQRFEQSVAHNPAAWPGEAGARARALVWFRMGQNAAHVPDADEERELPPFLRRHPDRPRPLNPPPEKCFERSLELAPGQLDALEALFLYWQRKDKPAKAKAAAQRLLERHPDHVPTLVALADLHMEGREYAEALALLRRALRANPLDRRLRRRVSTAHTFKARGHAEAGDFDEARAEYRAALALRDGRAADHSVFCKWAACEFKAGDAGRAEELLRQALAEAGNRLAVAFGMLIEVIRLKLPRPLKTRFDREFKEALAEPPTGAGAAAAAETAAAHALAGVEYVGRKTHEKKVLAYLERAQAAEFAEEQLRGVCAALRALKAFKLLEAYARLGQRRFPDSPDFYLAEADALLARGPYRHPAWQADELLKKARQRAEKLSPDDRQKEVLKAIQQAQDFLASINPFSRLSFFGGGGPFGDGDEDEEGGLL